MGVAADDRSRPRRASRLASRAPRAPAVVGCVHRPAPGARSWRRSNPPTCRCCRPRRAPTDRPGPRRARARAWPGAATRRPCGDVEASPRTSGLTTAGGARWRPPPRSAAPGGARRTRPPRSARSRRQAPDRGRRQASPRRYTRQRIPWWPCRTRPRSKCRRVLAAGLGALEPPASERLEPLALAPQGAARVRRLGGHEWGVPERRREPAGGAVDRVAFGHRREHRPTPAAERRAAAQAVATSLRGWREEKPAAMICSSRPEPITGSPSTRSMPSFGMS